MSWSDELLNRSESDERWVIAPELVIDSTVDIDFLLELFSNYEIPNLVLTPYLIETYRTLICIGDVSNYKKVLQQLTKAKNSSIVRKSKKMIAYFTTIDSKSKAPTAVCSTNKVLAYVRTKDLESDYLNEKSFLSFLSQNSLEEYKGFELPDGIAVKKLLAKRVETGK